MLTQLVFAARDVWRKPVVFVFFIIQLSVSLLFCFVSISQVMYSARYIRTVNRVSSHNVVFFSRSLGTMARASISPGAKELLVAMLDEAGRGYSVVENVELRDYPNINTVVGLGAFAEVFSLANHSGDRSKPQVLIGYDVDALQVGSIVNFGRRNAIELTASMRLPRGASYVMTGAHRSLDKSIIILADVESMMVHHFNSWEYGDQIVNNTCLLGPTGEELTAFVSRMMKETGVALNPIDLGAYAKQHHFELFYGALYFLVFFGISMASVIVGIIINTIHLLDSHMTEYAIHLLAGARMEHLCSRIVIYLFILVSLPVVVVSLFLFQMFRIPLSGLIAVIPPLVLFVVFLASIPMVKLYRTDIFSHLRSDD